VQILNEAEFLKLIAQRFHACKKIRKNKPICSENGPAHAR
jgi:hypothetical protein